MTRKALHLWEVKHPYYCNESAYKKGSGDHKFWHSWEEFYDEFGESDLDYNLVFRWDWSINDNKQDKLLIFVMGQRKGYFWCHEIDVCKNDEQEVRNWLILRMKRLWEIWEPLSLGLTESMEPDPLPAPKFLRDKQSDINPKGSCESCEFSPVKIKRFSRNPGEAAVWLCDLCANTYTSTANKYDHDNKRILTTIVHCANAINKNKSGSNHELYDTILKILETTALFSS